MRKAATNKAEKKVIRKQTRKALKSGMPVLASKKGLGITHNEGGKSLQNAVNKLGYKKAEKLVQRVKANKAAPSRGKKRA